LTTNEKIAALRAAAQAAGAHGILLMTSDPHSSEYLPAYYNSLPFFSGFTGENSTLVVTLTGSALWCDGRFYVQGDRQLAGTEIECMHAGSAGVPTVEEYLTAHFAAGQTLLLDGSNDRRSRAGFDIQQICQATVADSSAEFAVCGIGEIGQTALFFGSDGGQ